MGRSAGVMDFAANAPAVTTSLPGAVRLPWDVTLIAIPAGAFAGHLGVPLGNRIALRLAAT